MKFECDGKARLITEWSAEFEEIYKEQDSKRTIENLWTATMGHCAAMGEAIRRTHYLDLLKSASHAFCWMCSYVSRCNNVDEILFKMDAEFSEIVGLKYPQRCGHCEGTECSCRHVEIDQKKDKAAKYVDLYNVWKNQKFHNYDLNEWLAMFWKIYSGQIHLLTLESIGFHFLEEVGENGVAIRSLMQHRKILDHRIKGVNKTFLKKISTIKGIVEEFSNVILEQKKKDPSIKKPIIDHKTDDPLFIKARIVDAKMAQFIELADTFSWFCSVLIKLNEITSHAGMNPKKYNIETFLQKEYGKKGQSILCPTCEESPCACLFYF